jgi:hypothetical protein
MVTMPESGADEPREQGMGLPRARSELRMELAGDEPRVVGQLDDLDQLLLGPHP